MAKKAERICAHCGAGFETISEHMSHVVKEHDTGFVPRNSGRRLLRASTCWSCAEEIPPTETHCACGALHPRLR